jgi:hypothetical protein
MSLLFRSGLFIVIATFCGVPLVLFLISSCDSYRDRAWRERIRQHNCASWNCPTPSRPMLIDMPKQETICVCVPFEESAINDAETRAE